MYITSARHWKPKLKNLKIKSLSGYEVIVKGDPKVSENEGKEDIGERVAKKRGRQKLLHLEAAY